MESKAGFDKKTIAIIVLLAVVILFYWQILEFFGFVQKREPSKVAPIQDTVTVVEPAPATPPAPKIDSALTAALVPDTLVTPAETLTVNTGKYSIRMTSAGGGPVSILLNEYTYKDGRPIQLLPEADHAVPELTFAQRAVSSTSFPFTCSHTAGTYAVTGSPLDISYRYLTPSGGELIRRYRFYPDRYDFDFWVEINNRSKLGFERQYELVWNSPLGVTEPDPHSDYETMEAAALMSGSLESLKDFEDGVMDQSLTGSATWAGVRSKYFAAVFIPRSRPADGVFAHGTERAVTTPSGTINVRRITAGIELAMPLEDRVVDSFTVFVGPLDYPLMASYGVDLQDIFGIGTTPFVGWLIKPFALGIIWLLPRMYALLPNYGVVIIVFALLIKLITLPLSLKSFKSMAAMRELQPKLEELKKRFAKDPQGLNQAMMRLYKEHGVNPISGCLPMLPQMPLFFALFSVFRSTILLREAPFVWFIDDLSLGAQSFTDPYIILVLLMIGFQFVSQKLTMASNQQNKMLMYLMPPLMGFLFYRFAAGLVLYWTCFSAFSLLDYAIFKRTRPSSQPA